MTDESKQYLYQAAVALAAVAAVVMIRPFEPVFTFAAQPTAGWFGWGAGLLLLLTLLYSIRKREALQWPGKLIYWKIAHVAAGYIFLVALALHANGNVGVGLQLLINLTVLAIALSGLWGIVKQGYVPLVMTESLMDPVYKSELQDSVERLMEEIDEALHPRTDRFHEIYQRHILPYTVITYPSAEQQANMLQRCFGPEEINPYAAARDVGELSDDEKEIFYEIAAKALDVVEIRRSQSYQRQMNGWLSWHIGFALILFFGALFHIISTYYY